MSERLTDLHPSGFAAVPLALMVDERAGREHLLAYAGVASVTPATGKPGGPREIPNAYLQEASRLSYHVMQRALADLEAWGYLDRERTDRRPTKYRLLATPDVGAQLEEKAAAREAARPEIAGHRGGRPPKQEQKPTRAQDARDTRAQDARPFRSVLITEKEKEQQPLNNPRAPRTREGFESQNGNAAAAYEAYRPPGLTDADWSTYFAWCQSRARTKGNRGGLLPTMLREDLALWRDEEQTRRAEEARTRDSTEPATLAAAGPALEAARVLEACELCTGAGWLLDDDGIPLEPSIRCDHSPDRIAATA